MFELLIGTPLIIIVKAQHLNTQTNTKEQCTIKQQHGKKKSVWLQVITMTKYSDLSVLQNLNEINN